MLRQGPKPATPHTGAAHLWRELRATNYAERLQYAAFAGLVPDPFFASCWPACPAVVALFYVHMQLTAELW